MPDMNTKYFSDIIGHKHIIQALLHTGANQRVAHAYLFSGVEGLGKYKTAWAFARMLQCTCQGTEGGPPCLACNLADGQAHPDITTIVPQGATMRIEQIREIHKTMPYNPRVGKRKIFILDGAERLTEQAANSLLKILEEPPAFVVFILLTLNIHSVLPTIISRCQCLSFQAVPETDIMSYFVERGYSAEQAAVVAAVSGGIPGRALRWSESGQSLRDEVINRLEDLAKVSFGRIWDIVSSFDQEREQILITFELISFVIRDCLVWMATGNRELLLYKDCGGRIAGLAKKAVPDKLLAVHKELVIARQMLLGNANSRLLWEKLCLRMQDALQGGSC